MGFRVITQSVSRKLACDNGTVKKPAECLCKDKPDVLCFTQNWAKAKEEKAEGNRKQIGWRYVPLSSSASALNSPQASLFPIKA